MKKIIKISLIITLPIFLGIILFSTILASSSKLRINYYRYESPNTCYAWIWPHLPEGGGGLEYPIEKKDIKDKWLTLDLDLNKDYPNSTHLGIILKDGKGWNNVVREPGGDRYLDLSKMKEENGIKQVYFFQGDEKIFYEKDEFLDLIKGKIIESKFTSSKEISIKTNEVMTKLELIKDDKVIKTLTSINKKTVIIKANDYEFDIKSQYQVEVEISSSSELITRKSPISLIELYDTKEFTENFTYNGTLGAIYEKEKTTFKLWAPITKSVTLNLYNQGHPDYDNNGKPSKELTPYKQIPLKKGEKGVFSVVISGDLSGKYYTYTIDNSNTKKEIVDPYTYSTGANGLRGMIVDFSKTNPSGWLKNYQLKTPNKAVDYILYEAHIRDFTTHPSWNGKEEYKGTFLGFAETGTTYTKNGKTVKTGIDHIAELGVNAIHLLPVADSPEVDETRLKDKEYMKNHGFNWGYMTLNYNTLEGAYSTNPFDGYTRIKEFKTLIKQLNTYNIKVIMDVVFNHIAKGASSNLDIIVPGYYLSYKGVKMTNSSGVGNDTRSERPMFRKLMKDSLKFYYDEYNIGGFRFDIMSLHDIDTMKEIREQFPSDVILYGEGWDQGSECPIIKERQARKENISKIGDVGVFEDKSREGMIKFNFNDQNPGFSIGKGKYDTNQWNNILYGAKGGYGIGYYNRPSQYINYVSAHDNPTLYDKLLGFNLNEKEAKQAQAMSISYILTGQGIPFLHAGCEILRRKEKPKGLSSNLFSETDNNYNKDKNFFGNSYNLPDSVNQINWEWKIDNFDLFYHIRGLIAIRRKYKEFRMNDFNTIKDNFELLNVGNDNLVFRLKGKEYNLIIGHKAHNAGGGALEDNQKLPGYNYYLLSLGMINKDYIPNPNGIRKAEKITTSTTGGNYAGTTIYLETKTKLNEKEFKKPLPNFWEVANEYNKNAPELPTDKNVDIDQTLPENEVEISSNIKITTIGNITLKENNNTITITINEIPKGKELKAITLNGSNIGNKLNSNNSITISKDRISNNATIKAHFIDAPKISDTTKIALSISMPLVAIIIGSSLAVYFILKNKKKEKTT